MKHLSVNNFINDNYAFKQIENIYTKNLKDLNTINSLLQKMMFIKNVMESKF